MTKAEMAELMRRVFEQEIMALREAGQNEYAHNADNAFSNFERAAGDLALDRKMVLWIFAMKHRDGIASFLKGHRSQREDVRGRINDLIVYLFLLRGMVEDESAMLDSLPGGLVEVAAPIRSVPVSTPSSPKDGPNATPVPDNGSFTGPSVDPRAGRGPSAGSAP